MTDLQLLFAILALLYLWECACWVRRGTVAFRTWLGQRWKAVHPGVVLGNQRGGFVFAWPLPPLGTFLTATRFPASLGPEGLVSFVSSGVNPGGRPPQVAKLFKWADARQIEASGKKLRINGETFLNTGSAILAEFLAAELKVIRDAPKDARKGKIEKLLRKMLDVSEASKLLEMLNERGRWIRIVANAFFVYLFGVAPLLVWQLSFGSIWPALLAGLLACTITLAFLFRRAHLSFYPAAEDERFTHFLIVLLSPATAIRALDLLSRPLLECYHPMCVAKALSSQQQFMSYARWTWRELNHPALPLYPDTHPEAEATERYWREAMIVETRQFLSRSGIDVCGLLQTPKPNDAGCVAYCPRCEAQYTTTEGTCADCGGLKLVPLHGTIESQKTTAKTKI